MDDSAGFESLNWIREMRLGRVPSSPIMYPLRRGPKILFFKTSESHPFLLDHWPLFSINLVDCASLAHKSGFLSLS